jgi:hypothetical protein
MAQFGMIQARQAGTQVIEFDLTLRKGQDIRLSDILAENGKLFRFELASWDMTDAASGVLRIRLIPDDGLIRFLTDDSDTTHAAPLASEPACDALLMLPSESPPPLGDPPHP